MKFVISYHSSLWMLWILNASSSGGLQEPYAMGPTIESGPPDEAQGPSNWVYTKGKQAS